MPITMFDSITPSLLPAGNYAYAGYVGGNWATYPEIKARFPSANVLSIAINSSETAQCLDIEQGDAAPADAPAWVLRQKTPRPCLYASVSAMDGVLVHLSAAGIPRSSVRLWSAHYTGSAHICGPSTCKQMSVSADGTQWTSFANGINLDESLLNDDFFGVTPSMPPTVTYASVSASLPVLAKGMTDSDLPHWYIRRVQAVLNYVYGYPCTVDGAYGVATESAVKLLQAKDGLTQDGVCGAATWAKIISG